MNGRIFTPGSQEVFRHHWFAFWRHLAAIALLLALGLGTLWIWPGLMLFCFSLALIWTLSLYLYWRWHTLTFTEDNRLVRRRGFVGSTEDIISLFPLITPYQMPVIGQWFNVGSVNLGIPGPDVHIRHIANFEAFRNQLVYGTQQQGSQPGAAVQVIIQLLPAQLAGFIGGQGRDNPLPPFGRPPGATM